MISNTTSSPPAPTASYGSERPLDPLHLPVPDFPSPTSVDAEVYAAWKKHMIEGYQQNTRMFNQLLNAFMRPYWTTVWMYRLLFGLGVLGFILAAVLSVTKGIDFGVLFGGLTIVAFLGFFIRHPLQSLEQNLVLITWLGVIYNTYWTRLMYANDAKSIQHDLDEITRTTIHQINQLLDKQTEVSGKRVALEPGEKPPSVGAGG